MYTFYSGGTLEGILKVKFKQLLRIGHPDPEKRGAAGLKKIFFRPEFVPQFGLKMEGGGGGAAPRAPPLDPPLLIEEMFSTLTERNNI